MTKIIITKDGREVLLDDEDYERINQSVWFSCQKKGDTRYAVRFEKTGKYISMHREILNPKKEQLVDHINHDGLDNRKCNLRLASFAENTWNRRVEKGKTSSKFKGVRWARGHYYVYIGKDNKKHYRGQYKTEVEAALAYDKAALELHGEFANTNAMMCLYDNPTQNHPRQGVTL